MTYSVVQSNKTAATSSAVTSVACTYSSNVSSGNKLIAYVMTTTQSGTTDTVASVKDGAGNSFTQMAAQRGPATGTILGQLSAWELDVPAGDVGTKPTITATLSGGTCNMAILIREVSGLATGNPVDGTAGGLTAATTGSTGSPSYSSSASGEMLDAIYGDTGGPITWTAPSGYTTDASSLNTQSFANLAVGTKNSTGGTETGSWSLTGTATQWCALLVAYKLASTAITGTGSLKLAAPAMSGSGKTEIIGTGGLALAPMKMSGAGTNTVPSITGSGGLQLGPIAIEGNSTRNLILSIAPSAGTDGFGNPYPEGISVGAKGMQQVQILIDGGTAFVSFPTGASFEDTFSQMAAHIGGNSPAEFLQLILAGGAALSPANDFGYMEFNSAAQDGSSFANIQFVYVDRSGTAHLYAAMDDNGFTLEPGKAVAPHPGTSPATPETWQTLTLVNGYSAGANNGFVDVPQVRAMVDNQMLAFKGTLATPASPSSTVFASVPSGYPSAGFGGPFGKYVIANLTGGTISHVSLHSNGNLSLDSTYSSLNFDISGVMSTQ